MAWQEREDGGKPADAVEDVVLDNAGGAPGVGGPPVRLVDEDNARLLTILVMPNTRPSKDSVVCRSMDHGHNHRAQVACHQRRLEPAWACVKDEELVKGVLNKLLENVELDQVLKIALEGTLGEGLEEALEETDLQECKIRPPR